MEKFTIDMDRAQLEIIKSALSLYLEHAYLEDVDETDMMVGLAGDALEASPSENIEVFMWNA